MTLFSHHFRTEWRTVLVWSLVLGSTELLMVVMGVSMQESGALDGMATMIETLPPMMRELYGGIGDMTTLQGWIKHYSFGGWLHLPMLIFTGMYVAGMVTREMDRRTMEFLLAQPVARWQVILSRWYSLVAALAVLNISMVIGVVAGVLVTGNAPDTGAYLIAGTNGALLYLAVGSLLLPVSLCFDEYGTGLAVVLGGAVGSYMLHAAGAEASGMLAQIRKVLPYALFSPSEIIGQGIVPVGDLAILALVAAAGLGLAILLFQRKQIAV